MLVTEDGIVIVINKLQNSNAPFSMLVTEGKISRLANELHPSKAWS